LSYAQNQTAPYPENDVPYTSPALAAVSSIISII